MSHTFSFSGSGIRRGCVAECRACAHRALACEESAGRKQVWLTRALGEWAGALAPLERPVPEIRWAYRARVTLRAEWRDGAWRIGLQQRRPGERRPEAIEIPECPVQTPAINAAVASLRSELSERGIGEKEFPLAYVVINGAFVVLVLKTRRDSGWLERYPWLAEWRPEGFEGLWICFHPSAGRKVFSSDWLCVWGTDRVRGARGLWYAPDSFLQQIPELHSRSIGAAEGFLEPSPGDLVIDLYSGIGATLARWRARGASCLGVEIGASAVECAELNAGPGLTLRGDCANRVPQLVEHVSNWAGGGRRLLYANPPRTGLEPATLEWVLSYGPERIAHLSCSAGTLARDLRSLVAGGYGVSQIIPYDFFPQTAHVESLALLER